MRLTENAFSFADLICVKSGSNRNTNSNDKFSKFIKWLKVQVIHSIMDLPLSKSLGCQIFILWYKQDMNVIGLKKNGEEPFRLGSPLLIFSHVSHLLQSDNFL